MKPFTRTIKDKSDKYFLSTWLSQTEDYPFTVQIKPGKEKRSAQQNRLQFQWYADAGDQGDLKAHECRAFCKLHFGVPLLRAEDQEFREVYDSVIRPLEYEKKIIMMSPPIDLPVTSRMKVKTMSLFLNEVWDHFTGRGFRLTDPSMLGIEDYAKW